MPTEAMLEKYRSRIGEEIHVGPWEEISQNRIDAFADVTGDRQWIHIDPRKAEKESPFGTTVAHGFLVLSLLPHLTGGNRPEDFGRNYPGMKTRVNYGLNKVRFPSPVKAGSRIRARTRVNDVSKVEKGVQIIFTFTVEVEGEDKPACVAEQVFRLYP
jgi:acyl dehydratase